MIGLTFLFGLLRQFGIFAASCASPARPDALLVWAEPSLLFALKDGTANRSLLLSFQFGFGFVLSCA